MKNHHLMRFRFSFLGGVCIAFISVFIDWYLFQGVDRTGALLIDWSYNLVFDWYSLSHIDTVLNNWYRPVNCSIPLPITAMFIGLLVMGAFGALFASPEHVLKQKKSLKGFGFVNIAVILMLTFFILLFPMVYLFPNHLLYPFLIFHDYEIGVTYYFVVGFGYWLQIIAFTCCFPYACIYSKFANTVGFEPTLPTCSPKVNLDKYIAEAEFMLSQHPNRQLDSSNSPNTEQLEAELVYHQYMNTYHKEGNKV